MSLRSRRIVFFLTLLATFWALAQARHDTWLFRATTYTISDPAIAQTVPITKLGIESAASIWKLPFVALDNTCRYEADGLELSNCTGMVSSEAAIIYRFSLENEKPLYVTVRPVRRDFDIALGLFCTGDQGELICIEGSDRKAEGWAERIRLQSLPEGDYYLVVGGYGSDCGRFELSVETTLAPLVSLREFTCAFGDSGVFVRWETNSEGELQHFRLYRVEADGDGREIIFQPRSRGGFSRGARYEFLDRDADNRSTYILAGIDVTGREVEIQKQLLELQAAALR